MRRSREKQGEEEQPASRMRELGLDDTEQQEVKERIRPGAVVLHEAIREEGERELRRPASALAWSGFASGLSMGFSLIAEGLIQASLPDQLWRPLLTKLGYTIGFLIVVLGRQQLFTENTLTAVLPLLNKRSVANLKRLLRLWLVVLVTNLIGGFVIAWVLGHTKVFQPEVQHAFAEISLKSLEGGFGIHFLRAIFAGWLIALMVWLLPGAKSSEMGVIFFITYLVGLGELVHIIIGSVYVLYLVTTGAASWGAYFGQFMIPTLLGNIVGGVSLVAALNYGQVAPQANRKS
ncbi:MAG: formate/nitrite transporter family protein [Chroococcidiopsidaceae cyanobacterium CP_BM_ER_R8_30]|nr:formate/nitrite transporter family protein [Chroococcidiopsidaceae cyanobacterium CP_BM_ER_R8_30]